MSDFNVFELERTPMAEIKERLGWWEWGDPETAVRGLIPVCMALCDRVGVLEDRLAEKAAPEVPG